MAKKKKNTKLRKHDPARERESHKAPGGIQLNRAILMLSRV